MASPAERIIFSSRVVQRLFVKLKPIPNSPFPFHREDKSTLYCLKPEKELPLLFTLLVLSRACMQYMRRNFHFDNNLDFQFTIFTYFQFTIFKDFQFDNNMDFYSISTYLNLSWLRIFKLTLIRTPDFYFYHFFQNSNFSWTSQTQTSPNDVIFCQSRCSGLDQQSSGTCIKNLLFGASHFFFGKTAKVQFYFFVVFSFILCQALLKYKTSCEA